MRLVRFLLLALCCLFAGVAHAQALRDPGAPCDRAAHESCWTRAGVARLGGGAQATPAVLDRLTQGLNLSAADREAISSVVLTGRPTWVAEIPRNYRVTRMLFGSRAGPQSVPNVVAVTDQWGSVTRMADFYRIRLSDGRLVYIVRPHVCDNWSVRVVTPQGDCAQDVSQCSTPECLAVVRSISGGG